MTTPADAAMQLRAERAPFVMLPRWLLYHPDVSEGAKFLYCVLHDLVAGRQGPTRPVTRAELAACCGVSVDTIDRRLAQLVAASAVEKHTQVRAGGQIANVYQVWLTPPDGLRRTPNGQSVDPADDRSRESAAPVEGAAKTLVSRSREIAAPHPTSDAEPQDCGGQSRASAAPSLFEEEDEEDPPQPPRTAGGPDAPPTDHPDDISPRRAGTNSRALGANPRAEADRAEESRQREAAKRREAELAAAAATRRAHEEEARAAATAFEAEATALSAVLNDAHLAAVVALATDGLAGPLARSPFAAARAVVGWCRGAASRHPGLLAAAVDAALANQWHPIPEEDETAAPFQLPPPPTGTPSLRDRLAPLVRPSPTGEEPG